MNQPPYYPPQQPQYPQQQPQQQWAQPPNQYAAPPQGAGPAASAPFSKAIADTQRTRIFEHTGTVAELEQAFGVIRAMVQQAHKTRPLLGFGAVGALGIGLFAGFRLQSPFPWGFGLVGMIVLLILMSRFWYTESRRIEMASGLVRKLDIAPDGLLRVRLDLRPLQSGGKRSGAGPAGPAGWRTSNFEDPWLDLEGTLASGIGFYYRRTDCMTESVKTEHYGRTTRITTRKTGTFTDGVTLRFSPQQYPRIATLSPDAAKVIKLPEGMDVRSFTPTPGALTLVLGCPFKWDAAPYKVQAFDGVAGACIVFELAHIFLDKDLPVARSTETVPRQDQQGAMKVAGATPPWLLPAVLAVVGAGFLMTGVQGLINYVKYGNMADDYRTEAKKAKDKVTAKMKQDYASGYDDDATVGIVMSGAGFPIGLGLFVAAGIVYAKKKKKIG